MKRRSKDIVVPEVLRPRETEQRRGQNDTDLLDALVQKRVAAILSAKEGSIFEPFFRSRQEAYEIRRLQTVPQRKRWSVFFEEEGCLRCQKQGQPYGSIGCCQACYAQVFQKLKKIDARLMQEPTSGEREK